MIKCATLSNSYFYSDSTISLSKSAADHQCWFSCYHHLVSILHYYLIAPFPHGHARPPPPRHAQPPLHGHTQPPLPGYAQPSPPGYAQSPPSGYAQSPPSGYAQSPLPGYAQSPLPLWMEHEAVADALVIACLKGNIEIVSELLQNGVSPDLISRSGLSSLVAASEAGHANIVELLLSRGAQVDLRIDNIIGASALMVADNTEIVHLLLKHGAQVDFQDYNGETALMAASRNGNIGKIRVLLKNNARINFQAKNGMTALVRASCHGNTEAVRVLLEHGAQVDLAENNDQQTALILASMLNHIEIVQLLLDHRANVNWRNKLGKTALIQVAFYKKSDKLFDIVDVSSGIHLDVEYLSQSLGSSKIIKLLLDHGAEVDLQDNDGLSALMEASIAGNTEVVQLLLEHNASRNLKDKRGVNALALASAAEFPGIVRLLMNYGKKPNDINKESSQYHPLPICVSAHSEFPQLPSPIGKEQEELLTTTDKTRSKLPHTETKKEDAQVEKELSEASVSTIGKKQEKPVTTAEKHTLPSDNRELIEVNHPLLAIPEGHTELPQLPYVKEPIVASLSIRNEYTELKLLASRWYQIGIFLDMEPGTLDTIKTNNPTDVEVCLMYMIKERMVESYQP